MVRPKKSTKQGTLTASQMAVPSPSEVLRAEYLQGKHKRDELSRRLKHVADALRVCDQDAAQISNDLQGVANVLSEPTFLRHQDREIKVLAACCLADILRIFAPDAPFDDASLKNVFTFFVGQLRGLDQINGPSYPRYYYLLERLNMVKAFIIITDFDTDDLLRDLVDMFFDIVQDGHSNKVVSHMVDIMGSCIDEMSTISQPLLDSVLAPLIPPHENLSAYRMATSLVEKSANRLQPYITTFLRDVVVHGKSGDSELAEHAYTLIAELNQISSSLLLYVLPHLVNELKVEDLEKRRDVVKLLGRMFAVRGSALGSSYIELFNEFLGRFSDRAIDIRLMMVAFAKHFLLNHPELWDRITEILLKHVHDVDEKMRRAVVTCIVDAAILAPQSVTKELLDAAIMRTRDKKLLLRREASEKMAILYRQMAVTREKWTQEEEEKFGRIPGSLMHAVFAATEDLPEVKLRLDRMLDEDFLPFSTSSVQSAVVPSTKGLPPFLTPGQPASSPKIRAEALVHLFAKFDDSTRRVFATILREKRQFQQLVLDFVQLRKVAAQADEDNEEAQKRFVAKGLQIAARLPDPPKGTAREAMTKLGEARDNKIFNQLAALCAPQTSLKALRAARQDILQRIGQKSQIYDYVRMITMKAMNAIVTRESVPVILSMCELAEKGGDVELASAALGLLECATMAFPEVVSPCCRELADVLEWEDEELVGKALIILRNAGTQLRATDERLAGTLLKTLTRLVEAGTPDQAKPAVQAIARIFAEDDSDTAPTPSKKGKEAQRRSIPKASDVFTQIMDNVVPKLTSMKPGKLCTALTALGQISLVASPVFLEHAGAVVSFLFKLLLRADDDESSDGPDVEIQSKVLAVKCLIKYILPLNDEQRQHAAPPVVKSLVKLLMGKGRMAKTVKISDSCADALVVAAALALIKLCSARTHEHLLSAEQFLAFVDVVHHESDEVRGMILRKLIKHLNISLKNSLPLRFLAVLPLFAGDSEQDHVTMARQAFTQQVRQRRVELQKAGSSVTWAAQVAFMPEYALPSLIHTLSHHPDFPADVDSIESSDDFGVIYKAMSFYLNEIIKAGNTITFVTQLLETIKSTRDALEPSSLHIHVLCDLGFLMIKRRTEARAYEDAPFPGAVRLPGSLFTRADGHLALPPGKAYLPPHFRLADRSATARMLASPSKTTSPGKPKTPKKAKTPSKSPHASGSGAKRRRTSGGAARRKATASKPLLGTHHMSPVPARARAATKKTRGSGRMMASPGGSVGSGSGVSLETPRSVYDDIQDQSDDDLMDQDIALASPPPKPKRTADKGKAFDRKRPLVLTSDDEKSQSGSDREDDASSDESSGSDDDYGAATKSPAAGKRKTPARGKAQAKKTAPKRAATRSKRTRS